MRKWDATADDIQAEIKKYSGTSYAAYKAGDYASGDVEWKKVESAYAKLTTYLGGDDA